MLRRGFRTLPWQWLHTKIRPTDSRLSRLRVDEAFQLVKLRRKLGRLVLLVGDVTVEHERSFRLK